MILAFGKVFGPWSSWSPCSASCMDDVHNFPYQRRTRTCYPDCTVGFIEDRPCVVPMCQPGMAHALINLNVHRDFLECPKYHASDFAKDPLNPLRLSISFRIELGKVPFGKLVGQELELFDSNGASVEVMRWQVPFPSVRKRISKFPKILHETKTVRNDDSDRSPIIFQGMTKHSFRQILSLRLNETYIPKIRIKSEVELNSLATGYERLSNVVQECQGQVLVAKYWTCDNGRTEIFAWQVCDGTPQCPDYSDEKDEICRLARRSGKVFKAQNFIHYSQALSVLYLHPLGCLDDLCTHWNNFLHNNRFQGNFEKPRAFKIGGNSCFWITMEGIIRDHEFPKT